MSANLPVRLVIGIGNAFRRDDGVGVWVAQLLRGQLPPCISLRETSGEGTTLIEAWRGASSVVLVDAVSSGSAPGTIHRRDAALAPIPSTFFRHSTHAFGVAEAIEMSRALHQLPQRLTVYGIEGENFGHGTELSPIIAQKAEELVEEILREARRWCAEDAKYADR